MLIDKNTRSYIIKNLVKLSKFVVPIEDECSLSKFLYYTHNIISILVILSFFIFTNIIWQTIVIIWFILLLLSNILFDGCLLTMIELKLCPNSRISVDNILDLFGLQINKYNRKTMSISIFILIIVTFSLYYYYLHFYNK
jgi:hypothetical protein